MRRPVYCSRPVRHSVEPPAAGAPTIPFRRSATENGATSVTPAADVAAVRAETPTAIVPPSARIALLIGGSALAGAAAFYALFGGNGQQPNSVANGGPSRDGGVPQAEAAGIPASPDGRTPGTVGSSVAAATGTNGEDPTFLGTDPLSATPPKTSTGPGGVATVPAPGAPMSAAARERAGERSRALADAAIALLRSRQPEAARRMIDSALAMDPTDPNAFALRARANAARGDLRAAWADAEVAERLGDSWQAQTLIATFEARVGERRAARGRLSQLVKRVSPNVPFSAKQGTELALAYVATGDPRRALTALLRTRDDGTLAGALRDPGFDPIRGEPRFRDILRAVAPDAPQ